jgi:hypothetical protein
MSLTPAWSLDGNARHRCGTLTASVVEIVGTATVCRRSEETYTVNGRTQTRYTNPDFERLVMSATPIT